MEITRTANAGVLLKLDGVSILLDGVCREVKPYPVTPPEERARLTACFPDVVAFTHAHKDHYDSVYAAQYQRQTNGVVLGPEDLPGVKATAHPLCVGGVTVTPVSSRHIGAAGKTVSHVSFIIQGSACIWFMGDSSPLQWRDRQDLPAPDVLIAPYAYATTRTGWLLTRSLQPRHVILLHLPDREQDTLGVWDAVEATVEPSADFYIPAMSEQLQL